MTDEVKTIVTARDDMSTKKELNAVEIVPMKWWQIVLVRAARVYIQGLLTFLTTNVTGATTAVTGVPVGDFGNSLLIAASLAVAPATGSVLMNILELLAKLDQTQPQLRA